MTRHPKSSPHYDVWFGKLNLPEDRAFWFRYTHFVGEEDQTHVWAIFFDRDKIIATKSKVIRISGLQSDSNCLLFWDRCNFLSTSTVEGAIPNLSWQLSFKNLGKSHVFVPAIIGRLGLIESAYRSCFQDVRFSGEIRIQNQNVKLSDQSGMIGHITGKKQAHDWVWMHCSEFEGHPDVVFEGLSVRLKRWGKLWGPFSTFVLYCNGRKHIFDNLGTFFCADTNLESDGFRFVVHRRSLTLAGRVCFGEFRSANVEYQDTDGSKLYCRNSKRSRIELELTDNKTKTTQFFVSNGKVAFERVDRQRPDRIDL